MNCSPNRNISDRQRIPRLNRRFSTTRYLLPNDHSLRCNNIATLTIRVKQKGDICGSVRVILKALDLGGNNVFRTIKIDHPIMLFMTTTLVARGDMAIIVTTSMLRLRFDQRCKRLAFVQVRIDNLDYSTTAR